MKRQFIIFLINTSTELKEGETMNQDNLRSRAQKFLIEIGLPVSQFARAIGFERSAYYKWIKQDFNFGADKVNKIDAYLSKYGF